MSNKLDSSRIDQARKKVCAALTEANNDATRDALHASLEILDTLAEMPHAQRSSKYAGSIDYTFEDEQYEPFGREIDVRVYYCWYDYDSADEPSPVWGATIEDIEVLAVRNFDKDGNEVLSSEHHLDLAWLLLNRQYEEVTEACTEDGYHRGAGEAPVTYTPQRSSSDAASPAQTNFAGRMARSLPTRRAEQERRHLG
jgi:hypothetical protein